MSASVVDLMQMLREWEHGRSDDARQAAANRIAAALHAGVASGYIRLIQVDDPLMRCYLDGGWDAIMTFPDYVRAEREKEAAKREYQC